MYKKIYFLSVVFALIIVMGINSSSAVENADKTAVPLSYGNILYVGGSGPGNYSTIQDAIDNASDDDTIFVFSGIYEENLRVYKKLIIEGENWETTIIDGNNIKFTASIEANEVQISDFTFTESGYKRIDAGITLLANNCIIRNNFFQDCHCSILIQDADGNTVENNEIDSSGYPNKYGIELINSNNNRICKNTFKKTTFSMNLEKSNNNEILENIFSSNRHGIWFVHSSGNKVLGNEITLCESFCFWIQQSDNNFIINNDIHDNEGPGIIVEFSQKNIFQKNLVKRNLGGIYLEFSFLTLIRKNDISDNEYGIILKTSYGNMVSKNNIVQNVNNAIFRNAWLNHWRRNYWGPTLVGPKIIRGTIFKTVPDGWSYEEFDIMTVFKLDWIPAKEPYVI